MPLHEPTASFSVGVEALRRIEDARKAREDQMRNALEIVAGADMNCRPDLISYVRFVRATAREGLGRDAVD